MLARLSTLFAFSVLAVTASPVVVRDSPVMSLPFTRRLKLNGSRLKDVDQARAAHLLTTAKGAAAGASAASIFNVPVTNGAVEYTATVGVGSPATEYTLIVDTGSSNTWVGAATAYAQTSTSADTGEAVSVDYGSGSFSGEEYTDDVTIGSFTITGQSIGVASTSEGFSGVDGILGIGPQDLTCGTLSPDTSACIPTVTDNAYSQGLITTDEVGISFEPTTSASDTNGELTFGGVDTTKYSGTLTYTPVSTTSPASYYVGIDQTVTYGTRDTAILSSSAGIADTGTTLILLSPTAYDRYERATGATYDDNTGLLRITPAQYDNLESLNFVIGGVTYEFTANAQIWPRSLNADIGGTSEYVYLIVNDLGSTAETGFEFINGMTWLERYYFVYDSGASTVGFATTSYTTATTN